MKFKIIVTGEIKSTSKNNLEFFTNIALDLLYDKLAENEQKKELSTFNQKIKIKKGLIFRRLL